MTARRKVQHGTMRVRAYPILDLAVEQGIAAGWRRAHKHTAKPTEAQILEQIRVEVMGSICESFEFPEDGECA